MKRYFSGLHKMSMLVLIFFLTACAANQTSPDPLPSWTEGTTKGRITEFVNSVTNSAGSDYVEPNRRIATFDNDGTLWSEKPTYFQIFFILDRVRALAKDNPEWASTQPFQAVLENDWATLIAAGADGLIQLGTATQTGITTEEFEAIVKNWTATARHPTTGKPYTAMVYQPMLELLDYLRTNNFKVFIVSGGGLAFMRPWTESVYGIPPEQVVGSSIETRYEVRDGKPIITRAPEMHFTNNEDTKPVAIDRFIGHRPILAFGNSDGDFEMLEWTTAGEGKRLGLLVHHTDAKREWAYDRESTEGRLDRGLDEAEKRDWVVVDMARDWSTIYPAETID